MYRRRLQYLVKWTGHDLPDWRPAEDMNELAAVGRFHENYPDKPGPRYPLTWIHQEKVFLNSEFSTPGSKIASILSIISDRL
jgi:hypothetical protein